MSTTMWLVSIAVVAVGIYPAARIASAAFFRAKFEYHKRLASHLTRQGDRE
jgi:hypothetical protein